MIRANPGMDMCFMLAAPEQGSHRSTEVSHPDIYISQLVSPQRLLAALAGVCWGSACEWSVSSLHGSMCRVACCLLLLRHSKSSNDRCSCPSRQRPHLNEGFIGLRPAQAQGSVMYSPLCRDRRQSMCA